MKYKKRRIVDEIEDKKKRILSAAVLLFAEKGFNGTTTKEIASKSNVSEGTIYKYFDTKKDILIELGATSGFDFFDDFIAETGDDKDDIEGILTKFAENWMKNITRNLDIFKVLLYEAQFHEEIGNKIFLELVPKGNRFIERILEEKLQQGKYNVYGSGIAMEALIGLSSIFLSWNELNYTNNIEGNVYSYDMIMSQAIETFLYGIAHY